MHRKKTVDRAAHIRYLRKKGVVKRTLPVYIKVGSRHNSPVIRQDRRLPAFPRDILGQALYHDRVQYMRLKFVGVDKTNREDFIKLSPKEIEKKIVLFKHGIRSVNRISGESIPTLSYRWSHGR
jgi:hypothetical protein